LPKTKIFSALPKVPSEVKLASSSPAKTGGNQPERLTFLPGINVNEENYDEMAFFDRGARPV
jgi:hypothetical protein